MSPLGKRLSKLANTLAPGAGAVVREVERELRSVERLAGLGLAAIDEVKGALSRVDLGGESDDDESIRVTPANTSTGPTVRPKVTVREPQPGDTVAAWLRRQR